MKIDEAVRRAIKENATIKRKSTGESNTRIKPTNTYDCCIIFTVGSNQRQSRYWNPTADDLIADDWQVINKIKLK